MDKWISLEKYIVRNETGFIKKLFKVSIKFKTFSYKLCFIIEVLNEHYFKR